MLAKIDRVGQSNSLTQTKLAMSGMSAEVAADRANLALPSQTGSLAQNDVVMLDNCASRSQLLKWPQLTLARPLQMTGDCSCSRFRSLQ